MQPLPHHLFLLCAIFETLGPFLHKYDLLLCAISQKLLLLIIHFNNFYFVYSSGICTNLAKQGVCKDEENNCCHGSWRQTI